MWHIKALGHTPVLCRGGRGPHGRVLGPLLRLRGLHVGRPLGLEALQRSHDAFHLLVLLRQLLPHLVTGTLSRRYIMGKNTADDGFGGVNNTVFTEKPPIQRDCLSPRQARDYTQKKESSFDKKRVHKRRFQTQTNTQTLFGLEGVEANINHHKHKTNTRRGPNFTLFNNFSELSSPPSHNIAAQ